MRGGCIHAGSLLFTYWCKQGPKCIAKCSTNRFPRLVMQKISVIWFQTKSLLLRLEGPSFFHFCFPIDKYNILSFSQFYSYNIGESPSSSASDVDNFNGQATVDKAALAKVVGSPQISGSHVITTQNRSSFMRLLKFVSIISLTTFKCEIMSSYWDLLLFHHILWCKLKILTSMDIQSISLPVFLRVHVRFIINWVIL